MEVEVVVVGGCSKRKSNRRATAKDTTFFIYSVAVNLNTEVEREKKKNLIP